MSEATKELPRAPRFWWEKNLFALVLLLFSTIYPFATAFNSSITPFGTPLVVVAGTLIVLILLSIFRDIGPTFVEKAEARFQNRYAADIYSGDLRRGAEIRAGLFPAESDTYRQQPGNGRLDAEV